VRKLQEIACSAGDNDSSSSSSSSSRKKKTCHVARQACQTTTAWLARFEGGGPINGTVCRDLCTPSAPLMTIQPAPAKKECSSSESVVLNVAIKMPPLAAAQPAAMKVFVSWHGKGMERPYAGKDDRLCTYMAKMSSEGGSEDPHLLSDVKVSSLYVESTKMGKKLVTVPTPEDKVASRLVVRYERRLAANQPGCSWHARHEVCRSTTVVILPRRPPKRKPTKISPQRPSPPTTLDTLKSSPPVQCKGTTVFDTSHTVVPLTSNEMKKEITYDTLLSPNGERTVENIKVPDSKVHFFVGFKIDDLKCTGSSNTSGTKDIISKDDILWYVKW
jgi:hypothetical protein